MNRELPNVYPWSPEGPPCLLLLDPSIWIATLCTSPRRHALKKAARKCGWSGVIRSDDEQRLGEIFLWFIEKPGRRKILSNTLSKEIHQSIHNILWMTFYNDDEKLQESWPLKAFCKKDLQKRWFLDLDLFKDHLSLTKPTGEQLRSIMIVACAFAMLQYKDAKGILSALLDYDPQLEGQLVQTGLESKLSTEKLEHLQPASNELPIPALNTSPSAEETPLQADEIDKSKTSSGRGIQISKIFEITRAWIQEGKSRADSFISAQRNAAASLSNLGQNLCKFQLDNECASGNIALSLNGMVDAAGKLDLWIDDWSAPLQEFLISTKIMLPPGIAALHSLAKQPRSSTGEMVATSNSLLQTLNDLNKFDADLRTKIQSLHGRIHSLQEDLQLKESYKPVGPFPPDDLLVGITLHAQLKSLEIQTRNRRDETLNQRKKALLTVIEQFRHLLPRELEALNIQVQVIETALSKVSTLQGLSGHEKEVEDLRKKIEEAKPQQTVEELAEQALSNNARPDSVNEIARVLATQGQPEQAATILLLLQEHLAVESLDAFDLNGFVSEYLDVCAALSKTKEFKTTWPRIFLSSPWIATTTLGDIHEEALRRRLAAAFLVLHCALDSSPLIGLFFALDLNVDVFPPDYVVLNRLLRRIANQEPITVISHVPERDSVRLEIELESFFRTNDRGDYLRQAAHGNSVAEMERESLFPKLHVLWKSVMNTCHAGDMNGARVLISSSEEIVEQAFKRHSLSATESPYYKKMIFDSQQGYLPTFERLLDAYVEECEDEAKSELNTQAIVTTTEISTELRRARYQDVKSTSYWLMIEESLADCEGQISAWIRTIHHPIHELLDHCPETIELLPNMVVDYCASGTIFRPATVALMSALRNLAGKSNDDHVRQLEASGCFRHARVLIESSRFGRESALNESVLVRIERGIEVAQQKLFDRLSSIDGLDPDISGELADEIRLGHYQFVELELSRHERSKIDTDNTRKKVFLEEVRTLKEVTEDIEQAILSCSVAQEWVAASLDRAARLRAAIQLVQREVQIDCRAVRSVTDIQACIVALKFAVDQRSSNFIEFDTLMPGRVQIVGSDEIAPPEIVGHPRKIPSELGQTWDTLSKLDVPTADNVRDDWGRLAKEFCRMCGLYHDLKTTLKLSPVKKYLSSYETKFIHPRSRCLDRNICLYLAMKSDSWKSELPHLKLHLDNTIDSINIVFVPNGADEIRRIWAHNTTRDNYLILDGSQIAELYDPNFTGNPLRQLLHTKTQPLTRIGLFKCEGYVHREKNLFVGRDDAIRQLSQQPASAIWGGRRIGKTSLLHALSDRLRLPAHGFKVAHVYADYHEGDPDLGLARTIAETLGLSKPKDVNALKTQLIEFLKEYPVAILIDEIDGYIEASRAFHGATKFPLARVLRGVVQSDAERRSKVVYAGFKQLFYEVKVRPNSDASDPFKNFLEPVTKDFGDLTSDQVENFLRIAFTDMLGIKLDPSVPRLVKEKTSGHPAFVQAMGDRILGLISNRWQAGELLEVTANDVEAVYLEESGVTGDHSAYIDYVNETLGWNLSHLGRAVMLALSIDIRQNRKAMRESYSRSRIVKILGEWTHLAPDEASKDLSMTLDFLVMTNMLHSTMENGEIQYSIAYLFYIDVLSRLGDLNKVDIPESIKTYHESESSKII